MIRTILKGLTLILFLSLLFSCVQETETNQDLLLEQEDVFFAELIPVDVNSRIMSETPKIRRCRVVKRYRPKGEVYRVEADVNNDGTFASYTMLAVFDKTDNGSNPQINPIKLAPVKSKGKNGKDIEVQSPEFGFTGDTDGQTYIFSLDLISQDGQTVNSQKFSVTFAKDGKNNETASGNEVIVAEFDVILTGFGGDKLQFIKGIREILALGIELENINSKSTDDEILKIVNAVPYLLKDNAIEEDALFIQKILLAAGAKVELVKN